MSKKTIFIGIVTLLILFIPALTCADQYYDQYPGNGFQPRYASSTYAKTYEGYMYHDGTDDAIYCCPVNFNVPDGSIYFIKSIGIRFKDNLTDGLIDITFKRRNLYTNALHTLAYWSSGLTDASPSLQAASKGTESGVKLVDTKKFAYWLYVRFYRTGDVNPSNDLILMQVRVHYGT